VNFQFPPFSRDKFIPNIGRTSKLMSLLVKALFAQEKLDLTKEQFIILLCIEEESIVQSELALITERNKGSLTRLLQSLEKKSYIKRRVCKNDSRVNHVEIDQKGKDILEMTKPKMLELFKSLQKGLDPKDLELSLGVMKKLQNNIQELFENLEKNKN
tara:strand:+ start:273 stop:746 length:474 start_codon:yes stop_codon:yes gene_type:complete